MFVKKPMKMSVYENGANQYGNRFGGNGFSDSLDTKSLGIEKWKPSEGENLIDIIPFNATKENPLVIAGKAEEGDTMYALEYFVHKGIGPANRNITCLNQYGCTCPLCEEQKRIKAMPGAEAEKKAQALSAKRRMVYVVHDLKNDKYGYWDTGWKSVEEKIQKLARVTIDPKTNAPVNIFDWQDGMSVKFYGEKKKFQSNDYIEPDLFSFVPRAPLSDEVLEHSVDLATVIKKTSAEEMQALVSNATASSNKKPDSTANENKFAALEKNEETVPQKTEEPSSSTPSFDTMKPTTPDDTPQEQAASPETTCPCGYTWGEADKHPECGTCKVWDACLG